MKLLCITAFCLLLLALESALLHVFGLSIVRADVAVAVVVFLSLRAQALEGAVGSFFAGTFVDILSGAPNGLYAFTAVLIFLIGRFVGPFVDVRGSLGFALLLLAVDAVHNAIAWGLICLGTGTTASWSAMLYAIPATAALTAGCALLMWRPLRSIDAAFSKPDNGGLLLR